MSPDLERLLRLTTYQAFDTDPVGRILAGSNDSGSTQLIEISGDGTQTVLTALPGACTGRYVTGERAVIVSHDDGGNERHQLSLLPLPVAGGRPAGLGDLQPLVLDPRYMHALADVRPGRICYFTNRRNGVAFDPVIRDLATGAERTVGLGDAMFDEAALSPDGRWLAVTVASAVTANSAHVLLVDLASPAGREQATEVTAVDDLAMNGSLNWTPDSAALILASNAGREFTGVARYDVASGRWTWLITDDSADLAGWLSPDGSLLLVERNDDGASVLSLHDASTGEPLREVALPATGCVTDGRLPEPRWSPGSATVALSVTGALLPGDVLLADARTGSVRQVTRSAAGLGSTRPTLPEQHRVPTPDGEQVPCLVYRGAEPAEPGGLGRAAGARRPGGPGQAELQHLRAGAGRDRAHRGGAQRPRLGGLRQALVLDGRRRAAPGLGGRPRGHPLLPAGAGRGPGPRGPVGRLVRGLHGPGRARVPAGAVGRRSGHRRHLVPGHVPGEHLGLPVFPEEPRANVLSFASLARVQFGSGLSGTGNQRPAKAGPAQQPHRDGTAECRSKMSDRGPPACAMQVRLRARTPSSGG
jgi:hypothetical protein